MRTVEVFTFDTKAGGRVPDGRATFHAWGCDYEEFEQGPGNFSTAIIERADGTVENVSAQLIKFVKAEEEAAVFGPELRRSSVSVHPSQEAEATP